MDLKKWINDNIVNKIIDREYQDKLDEYARLVAESDHNPYKPNVGMAVDILLAASVITYVFCVGMLVYEAVVGF